MCVCVCVNVFWVSRQVGRKQWSVNCEFEPWKKEFRVRVCVCLNVCECVLNIETSGKKQWSVKRKFEQWKKNFMVSVCVCLNVCVFVWMCSGYRDKWEENNGVWSASFEQWEKELMVCVCLNVCMCVCSSWCVCVCLNVCLCVCMRVFEYVLMNETSGKQALSIGRRCSGCVCAYLSLRTEEKRSQKIALVKCKFEQWKKKFRVRVCVLLIWWPKWLGEYCAVRRAIWAAQEIVLEGGWVARGDGQNRIRAPFMNRVGQNHIYTVCILYFWQGIHHIYGHIRCIYTVLANPVCERIDACINDAIDARTVYDRIDACV